MMNPKKMPVSHWGYSCIFQHANLQRDTVPIFRQNVIDSEDEFFPYHEALKVGNADLTKIIIAVFPISKQSYDALKLKLALEF